MNHQMPVITRRPKTEQTEEFFSEGVLGFGVDVEEGKEEAKEVDDDDVSFATRTVYLGNI